jgi:hypothetical protein
MSEAKLSSNDLLSCPFCGWAGKMTHCGEGVGEFWFAGCSNHIKSLDRGGCMIHPHTPPRYTEQEARDDWNRRQDNSQAQPPKVG